MTFFIYLQFQPPSGVEESDWLYVTQGEHEQDSEGLRLSHIVESLFNLSKEYSTPPVRPSLNKFFSQTPQSLSLMRDQDDSQMVSLSHQDTLVLSADAFLPWSFCEQFMEVFPWNDALVFYRHFFQFQLLTAKFWLFKALLNLIFQLEHFLYHKI